MIKLVQNKGIITDKLVAWVDIYFVDDRGNEFPLKVHKDDKIRFNKFLRKVGFTIGIIDNFDLVEEKSLTI